MNGKEQSNAPEAQDRRSEAVHRGLRWPVVVVVGGILAGYWQDIGRRGFPTIGGSFDREEVDLRVARQGTHPDKQLAQL